MSSQDSNRLYSWLWDSHISPKNSKWLQENLSDIDATVKQMIKIIEEDGDSFAKRAEMYYKRRPELMRLVEQFYRAYRGLAERYSHATGVIRQAHHTMAEAFPDQIPPLMLTEECQADCTSDKIVNVAELLFEFCEKGVEEVTEVKSVGNTFVLKGEKDDGLVRFDMILGRISALESRLSCAEEEFDRLNDQASRARVEVQLLTEALRTSEAEKENISDQYKKCVERISFLESELSQPCNDQVQKLKDALALAEAEKNTILAQHTKSASMVSSLQKKLIYAENEARRSSERADKAEDELDLLKKEITKLDEEKEVASLVYWQSIEKISSLEKELSSTQDEALKLSGEINSASFNLQGSEMHYDLMERSKDHLQSEMKIILEENTILRKSISDLNCALDESYVEPEFGSSYVASVESVVRKVEELKQKLRRTMDNNELLGLEKSVLVMLFGQLRLETQESEKERKSLVENLKIQSRKLTALENEVNERSDYTEKLENEIQVLNVRFSEVQDSYRKLRIKDAKVLQENMSVRNDFLELKRKNRVLEDENCTVLVEALSVSNTSLAFKHFVTEKTSEVEELEKTTRRLESDLELLRAENTHLARGVSNGKDLLREKESQLHRAEENLVNINGEKARMEENFEVMKMNFSKARETQESHILKLSSDNSREIENNMLLHKIVKQLDTEVTVLRKGFEETKAREMALSSELENERNETKELIGKLLISSVREAVFVEKANELSEIIAEKASVDALVEAVEALRSSFLYLELRARMMLENGEESEESRPQGDSYGELFGALAKVQDLQNRTKGLEKLIGDIPMTLRTSENLATEIKCEVPRDHQELHSQRDSGDLNSQQSDALLIDSDTPKDITLDKASKTEHHGSSRTDDRMLELWEIGSEGQSIDLTVSKRGHKVGNIVEEIMVADEGLKIIDKLEISKRFIDSYQEENKRKMVEKLEIDGLKLTNLQITIRDLMNKVSMTERIKKKDQEIEYNTVKEQLEEADESVIKLYEMNLKLKKAVQDNGAKSLDGKSQSEFEQTWNSRRRKILEHTNRGAERLTRLQLEVQKLQFLLMKLDNEQEKKLKTRIVDTGPKFLLKDYLHGRVRSVKLNGVNQSKKKIFCGCINPPTNGDSPRYKKN